MTERINDSLGNVFMGVSLFEIALLYGDEWDLAVCCVANCLREILRWFGC